VESYRVLNDTRVRTYLTLYLRKFADIMIQDLQFTNSVDIQELVRSIAGQIRAQCASHSPASETDYVPLPAKTKHRVNRRGIKLETPELDYDMLSEDQDDSDAEVEEVDKWNDSGILIIVKIEFNVGGNLHYKDQFEWPLHAMSEPSPETFARQVTAELGLVFQNNNNSGRRICC
jgi:hypothetical protein